MVLLLLILSLSARADDIADLIGKANQQVTRGSSSGCNLQDTGFEPAGECLELERRSIEDTTGRELPISVVSVDELATLRAIYNDKMRVYDAEVCAQRAHKIGDMLAKKGIETVKLYLEPGGFWPFYGQIIPDSKARARYDGSNKYYTPAWDYHVVNLVLVRDHDGNVNQYVIDPFMEDLPVPREKWEARLHENPNSSIGSERIISRFNFGPKDYSEPRTEYESDVLKRSYEIMSGDKRRD
jgi:hypothetical protein